jgi:hypothetical protein
MNEQLNKNFSKDEVDCYRPLRAFENWRKEDEK